MGIINTPRGGVVLPLFLLAACGSDTLSRTSPQIRIVPLPETHQTELEAPPGIDLGTLPLYGVDVARFRIENPSTLSLEISGMRLAEAEVGGFEIQPLPGEGRVPPNSHDILTVLFSPQSDSQQASATVLLDTNAGARGDREVPIQLVGRGEFVGDPALEVCYDGTSQCHRVPEACLENDETGCLLPTFDFGNIAFDSAATGRVILRNRPPADTCQPAPQLPACTPTCVVRFDENPDDLALGIGFVPGTGSYALEGNLNLPLRLGTHAPECHGTHGVARQDVSLLVVFSAGSDEVFGVQDHLVLESDLTGVGRITVPLTANVREGPVAIATLRDCGTFPPPDCSSEDDIRPLGRVYFDGAQSFDPRSEEDDTAEIVQYTWSVIDAPGGVNPQLYDIRGQGTAQMDLFVPLAGDYTVRLRVTNDIGLQSGITATSDVNFKAVPDSRLHVQLVWDHPSNDQDVHLVNADLGDLVYHSDYDCFWRQCRPSCADEPNCSPLQWFQSDEPYEGANPRLDIDATNGLGPENINISSPEPGRYIVYNHYYGLVDPNDDPTRVTLRIYVDGILRADLSRTLRRNDLWRIAEIQWHTDGTANVTQAPSDGGGVGSVKTLNYVPFPSGFDFSTAP